MSYINIKDEWKLLIGWLVFVILLLLSGYIKECLQNIRVVLKDNKKIKGNKSVQYSY